MQSNQADYTTSCISVMTTPATESGQPITIAPLVNSTCQQTRENVVIQTRLSPEMKNRLKALSQDADLPDNARQAIRECLAQ